MKEETLRKRMSATVASVVLAVGTVTGIGVAAASALANAPAQSEQSAKFEVDFLKDMIDHHTMASMMAETCRDKAAHDDLVDPCQSIIDAQTAEIEQMQDWLQDWYGTTYESQPKKGDMASMQRMDWLSGADYEIRSMKSMVRHHWAAVRMAEKCLTKAEHSELLDTCENIQQTQLEEIAQMQAWLQQWYDRNGGRPAEKG